MLKTGLNNLVIFFLLSITLVSCNTNLHITIPGKP